ncbi:MAG TPA: hypothetical protein VGC37_08660 [Friedmanniella sp.]
MVCGRVCCSLAYPERSSQKPFASARTARSSGVASWTSCARAGDCGENVNIDRSDAVLDLASAHVFTHTLFHGGIPDAPELERLVDKALLSLLHHTTSETGGRATTTVRARPAYPRRRKVPVTVDQLVLVLESSILTIAMPEHSTTSESAMRTGKWIVTA